MGITGNQNHPTEIKVFWGKNNKKGLLSLWFFGSVIRFHQERMFNH